MERKGQVTIFMIIGIVLILALIIVFVYLGISGKMDIGAFQQKTTKLPSEMRGIQTFVESCIKRTGEMALLNLGLQGGLYERVDDACFTKRDTCYNTGELGYLIPNYILNNDETQADTYFPTRDEFEDELNKFFNDNFNEIGRAHV